MERLVQVVRQAGTSAILEDPDAYIDRAASAAKWCRANERELFPSDGRMTAAKFYHEHYKPMRLADASSKTVAYHQVVLHRWEIITGDPAIEEVDGRTLCLFRDALSKALGRNRVTRTSPNTVFGYLSFVQSLLNKAGPAGYRNRDAIGLLGKTPWVKPPKKLYRAPKMATSEELDALYRSCVAMERPRIRGVKAPAWWRCLLVVAFNTGLRAGTLKSLRMSWIDWRDSRLVIPPERTKTGQGQVIHLTAAALDHLRSIRTDRDLVFPDWGGQRTFYWRFHQLQDAAGIARPKHIGMHAIRKATATLLWEFDPQAAQLTLGHTTAATTRQHYVERGGIITRALDRLPQPAAFLEKIGGAA